jgi:uncharacterized protein YciI
MTQDPQALELEAYWFVYFVRGTNKEPLTEEGRKAAMEGHLGNLTRLANEGKAVAAGPFAGDQDRRGIVLLKGGRFKSKEEAEREFAGDPLVKSGRLRVEVRPWATTKGSVKPWRTPEEMKSYVFVVLERGEQASALPEDKAAELQAAHLRHIFEMKATGGLGLAGPFRDDGAMRGVLVFQHNDVDKAKRLVAQDPLVKAGRLKATYLTLWMAAGIVGD